MSGKTCFLVFAFHALCCVAASSSTTATEDHQECDPDSKESCAQEASVSLLQRDFAVMESQKLGDKDYQDSQDEMGDAEMGYEMQACSDEVSNGMKRKGKVCTGRSSNWYQKVCKKEKWKMKKYCQQSCFISGNGYDGDNCEAVASWELVKKDYMCDNYKQLEKSLGSGGPEKVRNCGDQAAVEASSSVSECNPDIVFVNPTGASTICYCAKKNDLCTARTKQTGWSIYRKACTDDPSLAGVTGDGHAANAAGVSSWCTTVMADGCTGKLSQWLDGCKKTCGRCDQDVVDAKNAAQRTR